VKLKKPKDLALPFRINPDYRTLPNILLPWKQKEE